MKHPWWLAVGLLMTTGCVGTDSPLTGQGADLDRQVAARPVVVALLDSGIHPWHDAFQAKPTLQDPPVEAIRLGAEFRQRVAVEGLEVWNELEKEQLYWFEGTRVIAVAKPFSRSPILEPLDSVFPPDPHLIYDDVNHGTATASRVADLSPDAWILMVEIGPTFLDALRWTTEQHWIDIISISVGGAVHTPNNATSGKDEYAEALKRAVLSGKLVVDAGGNNPDPNLLSHSGAPWVISVGGAEADRHGVTVMTSQPVDVVANYTHHGLASARDDSATFSAKGTSFGAPLVAGVLAEALYELRQTTGQRGGIEDGALVRSDGQVWTNRDFRWALNMSARYWAPGSWDPTRTEPDIDPLVTANELTTPAAPHVAGTPVGPWLTMGWGHVDASTTRDVVRLLTGEAAAPDKRDATKYMESVFHARSTVWDAYQSRPAQATR